MIDHDELIHEQRAAYGDAWLLTGRFITEHIDELQAVGPWAFALVMIYNKLVRALKDPLYRDNYDDIIGYCKLVLEDWERQKGERGTHVVVDPMVELRKQISRLSGSFPKPHEARQERFD